MFFKDSKVGVVAREKLLFPAPNPNIHIPFWLKFLVLAAYEPQLSKELLVPEGILSDPRDNGSA